MHTIYVSAIMQGSIQLYTRATHMGDPDDEQDLTDDQLIDNMYIEIDNLTSFSPRTPMEEYRGDNGLLEARIQFEVNCDTDRYGPYCDVECHGRNDSEGHYLCNQNGDWECLEGYQNLETNCTECVAANGCSKSLNISLGLKPLAALHDIIDSVCTCTCTSPAW